MRLRPTSINSRINLEKKLRRQELKVARTASLINQDLRSKVERIEDLEAIRRLKAAYCDAWKGPGANKKKEIKISVTAEKLMLRMLLIFLLKLKNILAQPRSPFSFCI